MYQSDNFREKQFVSSFIIPRKTNPVRFADQPTGRLPSRRPMSHGIALQRPNLGEPLARIRPSRRQGQRFRESCFRPGKI